MLSQFYQRPMFTAGLLLTSMLLIGYSYMWYTKERESGISLQNTTKIFESMWLAVTTAHEETMNAYFMHYVMNDKTLRILKDANSSKEQVQNMARAKLFKHLAEPYKHLSSKLYVRQLHFHLPNNHSFLRFHAPNHYGDDLTQYRPLVVMTNRLLKPHFGFETGRIITGFRYVFPIVDFEGNHLGSVELSRPFEVLRQTLSDIDKNSGYTLLIKREDVFPKLFDPYKRLYSSIPGLSGWVLEDPRGELHDTVTALNEEYQSVFEYVTKTKDFAKLIESYNNDSIAIYFKGRYYKITGLKLFDYNNSYSAVVLAISNAPDIADAMTRFIRDMVIYTLLTLLFCLMVFLYLRETAITKRKQYELEVITSTMGGGLYVTDKNGNILFANTAASKLLGYDKEQLIGFSAHDTFHRHAGDAQQCPIVMAIKNGTQYDADDVFMTKNGSFIDVQVVCRPMYTQNVLSGAVVVFTDISELKRMQNELYTMSVTDTLTGLYNRRFMMEMLINTKNHSDRHGTPFSILMIDIDKFKSINDTYGHDKGDEVLVRVASVLKESIRTADVAARWGGEEFLVLLANTSISGAITAAEKIRMAIKSQRIEPIQGVTVSIGVTAYETREELKTTISRADKALYRAKASGRDCVCHE